MAGQTGRSLIEQALREPIRSIGWQPRAAGWFTRELDGEWLGVLAVGVAVQGQPTGHALATVHVGARHQGVEETVAELCGIKPSYRVRTLVTSIGYLMPERSWREWPVAPGTASSVAARIAAAVSEYGHPCLARVPIERTQVLAETGRGWLSRSAIDLARHLVATALFQGDSDARQLVDQARQSLSEGRHGIAAASMQAALEAFVSRTTP